MNKIDENNRSSLFDLNRSSVRMIKRFNVVMVVSHQFCLRYLVVAAPPASPVKQQPIGVHGPILKPQQPILPRERTAVDKVCL